MSDTLQYLERIQRDAQQVQRLADDLERARKAHEARKIRREIVRNPRTSNRLLGQPTI